MDLAGQLLVCLTAAGLCAGVVRRVPLPLPLVQTVAGTLLAWPLGMELELDPHAFLLVLIPPLLFIDAWRIPKRDFRQSRATILLMAFGLVAITVLGVGLLIDWLVPAIPLPVAFAIAAALSPTDAVAVAGMTGRVRVPPRLMTILQGEALFNDAAGLVAMRVAVGAMLTGAFSWGHALGSFLIVAAGGVAVGVALTWLFARLLKLVLGSRDESEAGARILLLLVLPYAAYLAAEHLGLSGILAAAAGGMVANRFAIIDPHHRATRLQGIAAFHMIELALNGLVFVLLGLQLPLIVREWPTIALDAQLSHAALAADVALVIGALLAIRFAWVWVSLKLTIYRQRARGDAPVAPPLRLIVATAIAGVRGAVSLAAALTLPLTLTDGSRFPAREVAIFVCAIVIVVWLVGASIGLPLLLRSVALPAEDASDAYARVRAQLAEAAIDAVEAMRDDQNIAPEIAEPVLHVYRSRLPQDGDVSHIRPEVRGALRVAGLRAERARLGDLLARHEIDEELHRRCLRELDLVEESYTTPG